MKINKALDCWPMVERIHQWLVDPPHLGPVMCEEFPCQDVIMNKAHLNWVLGSKGCPRPTPQGLIGNMLSVEMLFWQERTSLEIRHWLSENASPGWPLDNLHAMFSNMNKHIWAKQFWWLWSSPEFTINIRIYLTSNDFEEKKHTLWHQINSASSLLLFTLHTNINNSTNQLF